MSKCEYFVVSIDAMSVPRVVYGPTRNEAACDAAAERYWSSCAQAGEEVTIVCKHHEIVQRVVPSN